MEVRFMREAWVLLSIAAGDVTSWRAEGDSVGATLNFGTGGEKACGADAVLDKFSGDRLRWEAWMVLTRDAGVELR